MGIYFNPGNESFTKDKNSELYLDKTGLLEPMQTALVSVMPDVLANLMRRE